MNSITPERNYPDITDERKIYEIKQIAERLDEDDHLMILKKRYAKGEITKEEYEDMKSMLE